MPPFPTWLWWSLKVRTFWQETQQFCDNERLNETVTCDKTGEEHLWSSHQSAGWWPLWGRGEASGNRRCWWSRSGCVYARSAAPRAGSLRSAPQTPPHVSSCRRALVWFTLYTDCLKLHVAGDTFNITADVTGMKVNWPSVASQGTSCLPPVRRGTHMESSSLELGKSWTKGQKTNWDPDACSLSKTLSVIIWTFLCSLKFLT